MSEIRMGMGREEAAQRGMVGEDRVQVRETAPRVGSSAKASSLGTEKGSWQREGHCRP